VKTLRTAWLVPPILLSFALSLFIGHQLLERVPRLEDEMAEWFQARVFASGELYAASPPSPESFAIPFVLDYQGRRFSKYPPGHAALLSLGAAVVGDPWMVNPLLGALGLALIHRMAVRFTGSRRTAAWALWLAAVSPFYLLQTSTLMQHIASLVFLSLFTLGLLRRSRAQPALDVLSGAALGMAWLVRPYTALLLSIPVFGFLLLSARSRRQAALRRAVWASAGAVLVGAALPLYNQALTGEFRLELYSLYWPYDRLGFGPDIGPQGFGPAKALSDTGKSLLQLAHDLHGWPYLSLGLPLLGLWAARRRREAWLLALIPLILVAGHLFYFHNSRLYGPRYYAEAMPALFVLSVQGARWFWARPHFRTLRRVITILLVLTSAGLYLPLRLTLLRGLYDGVLTDRPVGQIASRVTPSAVVFIFADNWPEAAAFMLGNPLTLDSPVLFARYLGPQAYEDTRAAYPGHSAYFYRDGELTPALHPPPEWTPRYPSVAPPG